MKVYEIITEQIIQKLNEGVVPWQLPWVDLPPRNMVSKRPYRGINTFLLALRGFKSPYWLSWKQVNDLNGSVRSGEHGTIIILWKWLKVKEKENENKSKAFPSLRYYRVWNVEQCNGIKLPALQPMNPLDACETILEEMPSPPKVIHNQIAASYSPLSDTISMPQRSLFKSIEEYYSTIFHELTHSTGHSSRLDRFGITQPQRFGSNDYSKEELIAEMGSAFLCGHAGIQNKTIDNSAAYIQGWLKRLSDDKKLVIIAASQAQKAVDFILRHQEENLSD